jgi:thiosulfate/3-mercaptopyruvate sulfurtransferase
MQTIFRTGIILAHALVALTLVVASAAAQSATTAGYARPELLVETAWLAANLNNPTLRILDVRAADKYQQGHIPGAINVPEGQLDQKVGEVQDVAPAEKIADIFGSLGVGNEHKIIIYDDNRTLTAGRVFWVLDYYSHPSIALLNGGFPKWAAENRAVTQQALRHAPATFTATADASKRADAAYIKASLGKGSVAFCDARTPGEYTGRDVRAKRGGAIPGATNVDWINTITTGETPQMKLAADLQKLYTEAGITPDKEVITYCQSGGRAAQAYFTLRLLGYTNVRNYDGSWQEWGNDQSLPLDKKGG